MKIIRNILIANFCVHGIIVFLNETLSISYRSYAFDFYSILLVTIITSAVVFVSTKEAENEAKLRTEAKQRELLEGYVESLENLLEEMRAFRHDYKNILASMAGYVREGKIEELEVYLNQKMELSVGSHEVQTKVWKSLKDIEPMELKGFLYEKLLLIMTRDISVHVKVSENMKLSYQSMEDLIRILGVFIDNAIEEAETLEKSRIRLELTRTEVGILFEIVNPYSEKPNLDKMGHEPYSTKGRERGHGLCWAEKLIRKHQDMFHELKIEGGEVIQRLEIVFEE